MRPQLGMGSGMGKAPRAGALAAARRLRRLAEGPDSTGSGGTGLLVLVGVEAASAAATVPEAAGWPAVAVDELRARQNKEIRDAVAVLAGSVAELRQITPWLVRAGRARVVTVAVLDTDRPAALGVPAAVGGVLVQGATAGRAGAAAGAVTLRFAEPVAALAAVRAVLSGAPADRRPRPAAGLRLGLTAAAALPWAAGDAAARMVGPRTAVARETEHAIVDLLVGPQVHAEPDPRVPRLAVTEPAAAAGAALWLPPVDTAVIAPTGFTRAAAGTGSIRLTGAGPALRLLGADGSELARGDLRTGLTENHVAALRPLELVELDAADGVEPALLGRLLAQLCCAGVPTRAPELPAPVATALGADLTARLGELPAGRPVDPVARESWSVATRRAALTRFAPDAYWRARAAEHGLPAAPASTVSVLLATRRAEFVPFALAQIARQDWPHVETVLVLHGTGADADPVRAALAGFPRPLEVVEVGADVVFGQALNAGLARCAGALVTKMDDDDWYGPHHLTDLVLARGYSGATVTGLAGVELYLHGSDVTARWTGRAAEATGTWLAGPTQLIGAEDLRALGGWRAVPSAVDWHLLEAVKAAGGTLYATHGLGFLYYRGPRTQAGAHTWSDTGGDARWLDRDPDHRAGFHPPPHLDPLPHPLTSGGSSGDQRSCGRAMKLS